MTLLFRTLLTALAFLTSLAPSVLGAILIVKQDPRSVPRTTFQPGHYEGDGALPFMQPRFVYDSSKKDAEREFTVRLDTGEKGFVRIISTFSLIHPDHSSPRILSRRADEDGRLVVMWEEMGD
jgi:hypothetical protein